ncbi:VOC family protein [Paenibacillus sp. FSL R5-0914]|uniref:VOC family protein n=1 Tax=Paenibacillus sp. FSL R5-0914 TaxID=2921665 RepID=UPI0030F8C0FE
MKFANVDQAKYDNRRMIHAYVETHPELDELYEELKGKGAEFVQEPDLQEADWGNWKDFAIKDPDGYVSAFGSGKKH